jgi:hypothetical protein
MAEGSRAQAACTGTSVTFKSFTMIPQWTYITVIPFLITVLMTIAFMFKAMPRPYNSRWLIISDIWLLFQAFLAFSGFYLVTKTMPPRTLALIGPPVLVILFMFFSGAGRSVSDLMNLQVLTLLHVVRLPIEIILYMLYTEGKIPDLLTLEGRNFDIFSGITAPVVAWLAFKNKTVNINLLLGWNIVCLALVFNVMIHGILSAPSVLQQFAFDQPNTAVLYFPFVWLASFIVPVVIYAHLASIRKIMQLRKSALQGL